MLTRQGLYRWDETLLREVNQGGKILLGGVHPVFGQPLPNKDPGVSGGERKGGKELGWGNTECLGQGIKKQKLG